MNLVHLFNIASTQRAKIGLFLSLEYDYEITYLNENQNIAMKNNVSQQMDNPLSLTLRLVIDTRKQNIIFHRIP